MIKAFHSLSIETSDLKQLHFSNFKGKVVLLVNTATKCGFTPQFEGLEQLHQTYGPQGLVVIGFPCNQFGFQEPHSDQEMKSVCEINHGVTFTLTKKINVNGFKTHPIYRWLKRKSAGWFGGIIKWNFTKFIVDQEGEFVQRFGPNDKPESLIPVIEKLLATNKS